MYIFNHVPQKYMYTDNHTLIYTQVPSTGVHTFVNTQKHTQKPLVPR